MFLTILNGFVGLGAIFGGLMLILRPDGYWLRMSVDILKHSPFRNFLIPGLLLLVVIGCGSVVAAFLSALGDERAAVASGVTGMALMFWIVVEVVILGEVHWLHVLSFALGFFIFFGAWGLFQSRSHRPHRVAT